MGLFNPFSASLYTSEFICQNLKYKKLQPPRIWPESSGGLSVAYPGSNAVLASVLALV